MAGRAEAKLLVEEIAEDHGYLGEDVLEQMTNAVRRRVENAMRRKDELIASSVVTLARNLYTSNARFVFELLQNADDNHYTKARRRGEIPHVSFRVYEQRIVVECNEDGFTRENLVAICNVGKSSKTGDQGYIGEKGIGFKSVFMVAHTAYIQSGDFSFYFRHRSGDTGLGMISPVWQDPEDEVGDRLTRITLSLHQDMEDEALARQRRSIRQQFETLQETILLFMKNLEKVEVTLYEDDDVTIESAFTYAIERVAGGQVIVRRTTFQDGESDTEEFHYLTIKHTATGLAKHDNRTYSESEEASRAYSRSDVVLAFPVTKESVPMTTDNQWIFAFLPVRQMGFKFLIQADFVTQANRQDIVITSARNEGLAKGIAEAFVKGVLQMCDHGSLRFQWMRYLPREDAYPWDNFWTRLITDIKTRLEDAAIMELARPGPRRRIARVRRYAHDQLDSKEDPLFADIDPPRYLSKHYQDADLNLLTGLGLKYFAMDSIVARVRHDLTLPNSRMKCHTDEDWHDRAAKLLQRPFTFNWPARIQELRELDLLPLRGGGWISATAQHIYFSRIGELEIPSGLEGLHVICPTAAANVNRKRLFELLGVKEADIGFIRSRIFAIYPLSANATITPSQGVEHIRFLYRTHQHAQPPFGYDKLQVFLRTGRLINISEDYYIPDDEPMGPTKLLEPTPPGRNPGDGASGYEVNFLHQCYLDDPPEPLSEDSRSWVSWLMFHLSARRNLRLTNRQCDWISDEAEYVSRQRPDKFAEFVRTRWRDEGTTLLERIGEPAIIDVCVPCIDGTMVPLGNVYLPVAVNKKLCARFLREGEFFPWLRVEEPVQVRQWEPMAEGLDTLLPASDLDFALDILKYLVQANQLAHDISEPERVYNLYKFIQAQVQLSDDPESSRDKIRKVFTKAPLIFVPGHNSRPAVWSSIYGARWAAPLELKTMHCMEQRYQCLPAQFHNDGAQFADLFRVTLQIPDCQLGDLFYEISDVKDSEVVEADRIKGLYSIIHKNYSSQAMAEVKKAFEDDALIYSFTTEEWLCTSNCLWSSATEIPGKVIVNEDYDDEDYPELRNFFLDVLGVQEMTLDMIFDKLENVTVELTAEDSKQTLLACSSLLACEDEEVLRQLRQEKRSIFFDRKVFPVRLANGDIELCEGSRDFALIDRHSLAEDFAGKAKFLDFDMDQVRLLQPLISWIGLEGRSLSKMVREISSADSNSTRPISDPKREIRRRAHALLRIAKTYNSPRTRGDLQSTYSLLRNSETLETGRISTQLHLHQDGEDLVVEKEQGIAVHIHEGPEGLRVYIPRARRDRGACFQTKLPQRLCEWLMTDPTTQIVEKVSNEATCAVLSVLNAPPYSLSGILDQCGINIIDLAPEEGEYDEDDISDDDQSNEADPGVADQPIQRGYHPSGSSQAGELDDTRSDSSDSDDHRLTPPSAAEDTRTVSYAAMRHSYSRSYFPRTRPVQIDAGVDMGYLTMLSRAVTSARSAQFPSHGPFDMFALQAVIANDADAEYNSDGSLRLRFDSRIERDRKVGAAGELYVFELLSRLGLPAFSRNNWQSTIRECVRIHPDYADLAPWTGRETADITYRDSSGELTSLLADKGFMSHVSAEHLTNARPQYFIEVKTTTLACETPFFMSKYQYERMRNYSYHRTRNLDLIYVIFRVYNIGQDSVGLKVLVDPEGMRSRQELAFSPENWSVVPTPPAG